MYEYDTMEVNCEQSTSNSKGDLNRYTTKSSEVLTVLVKLYNMTYCSAPDGFYSEDEAYDKVSKRHYIPYARHYKPRLVFFLPIFH